MITLLFDVSYSLEARQSPGTEGPCRSPAERPAPPTGFPTDYEDLSVI